MDTYYYFSAQTPYNVYSVYAAVFVNENVQRTFYISIVFQPPYRGSKPRIKLNMKERL